VIGSSLFIGFEQRGLLFFSFFHPTAPKFILHFLIIIEAISYLTRLFSLSIRLFANMVAGHALLKILLSFTWAILTSFSVFSIFGLLF
jgi:F0F1-type ATP synthase membrane subunit a